MFIKYMKTPVCFKDVLSLFLYSLDFLSGYTSGYKTIFYFGLKIFIMLIVGITSRLLLEPNNQLILLLIYIQKGPGNLMINSTKIIPATKAHRKVACNHAIQR